MLKMFCFIYCISTLVVATPSISNVELLSLYKYKTTLNKYNEDTYTIYNIHCEISRNPNLVDYDLENVIVSHPLFYIMSSLPSPQDSYTSFFGTSACNAFGCNIAQHDTIIVTVETVGVIPYQDNQWIGKYMTDCGDMPVNIPGTHEGIAIWLISICNQASIIQYHTRIQGFTTDIELVPTISYEFELLVNPTIPPSMTVDQDNYIYIMAEPMTPFSISGSQKNMYIFWADHNREPDIGFALDIAQYSQFKHDIIDEAWSPHRRELYDRMTSYEYSFYYMYTLERQMKIMLEPDNAAGTSHYRLSVAGLPVVCSTSTYVESPPKFFNADIFYDAVCLCRDPTQYPEHINDNIICHHITTTTKTKTTTTKTSTEFQMCTTHILNSTDVVVCNIPSSFDFKLADLLMDSGYVPTKTVMLRILPLDPNMHLTIDAETMDIADEDISLIKFNDFQIALNESFTIVNNITHYVFENCSMYGTFPAVTISGDRAIQITVDTSDITIVNFPNIPDTVIEPFYLRFIDSPILKIDYRYTNTSFNGTLAITHVNDNYTALTCALETCECPENQIFSYVLDDSWTHAYAYCTNVNITTLTSTTITTTTTSSTSSQTTFKSSCDIYEIIPDNDDLVAVHGSYEIICYYEGRTLSIEDLQHRNPEFRNAFDNGLNHLTFVGHPNTTSDTSRGYIDTLQADSLICDKSLTSYVVCPYYPSITFLDYAIDDIDTEFTAGIQFSELIFENTLVPSIFPSLHFTPLDSDPEDLEFNSTYNATVFIGSNRVVKLEAPVIDDPYMVVIYSLGNNPLEYISSRFLQNEQIILNVVSTIGDITCSESNCTCINTSLVLVSDGPYSHCTAPTTTPTTQPITTTETPTSISISDTTTESVPVATTQASTTKKKGEMDPIIITIISVGSIIGVAFISYLTYTCVYSFQYTKVPQKTTNNLY